MDKYRSEHFIDFLDYGSNDAVIALLYTAAVYGYNSTQPVTLLSAGTKVMRSKMMDYLGVDGESDKDRIAGFDRTYRGLRRVPKGLKKREDSPGFTQATSLEPISDNARILQDYSSFAYHGGYNACMRVGYYPFETYDFDLKNAYPTAMCLVPDIDWENPIKEEFHDCDLTLDDFRLPDGNFDVCKPLFAHVRFEFPPDTRFPCIMVESDGVPVCPRTSHGLDGAYVTGPEVYLALRLGAKVHCNRGFLANTLKKSDGSVSYSLRSAVIQLVRDRAAAEAASGEEKSLAEMILKVLVNGGYGKNAQNVKPKSRWNALKDEMQELGCSGITNPVSASLTTAIIRCVLIAAMTELERAGYQCYSVTTDGFITNAPEKTVKALDIYGFRGVMEMSRLILTDNRNPEIWVVKHIQSDLLNFTTRGNVSLNCGSGDPDHATHEKEGVCAHASAKSGFRTNSFSDRLWLYANVLQRTGRVPYDDEVWVTFKEMIRGKDFFTTHAVTNVSFDFDLKRKPVSDTVTDVTVSVMGDAGVIANFDTEPFETLNEFMSYRKVASSSAVPVKRTKSDWESFFRRVRLSGSRNTVVYKDPDWARLVSVVQGYRFGKWDIPMLTLHGNPNDKLLYWSVAARCRWIQSFYHGNDPKRLYKKDTWKDAKKPDRMTRMLPREELEDLLKEMQEDDADWNQLVCVVRGYRQGHWNIPVLARHEDAEDGDAWDTSQICAWINRFYFGLDQDKLYDEQMWEAALEKDYDGRKVSKGELKWLLEMMQKDDGR